MRKTKAASAHKLFHTLVLSSITLGCDATHLRPPESDAGAQPDSAASQDASSDAFDPRYCEPGWPTTKGGPRVVCVDEEGLIRAPSDVPCAANYLCDLGVTREVGEPVDASCCLIRPDAP